jgi:hypothetical protein
LPDDGRAMSASKTQTTATNTRVDSHVAARRSLYRYRLVSSQGRPERPHPPGLSSTATTANRYGNLMPGHAAALAAAMTGPDLSTHSIGVR